MLEVRRAGDRFCTSTDWLTSWHSFSYGPWYDPDSIAFGPLTVLNHDVLAPGAGFDDHRHSGVDLVTYVVSGVLEHRDSTGHRALVRAGELQVLHSGAGVTHSERNASATEPVEYVQMWLRSTGPEISYEPPHSGAGAPGFTRDGAELQVSNLVPDGRLGLVGGAHYVYVVRGLVSTAGDVALGEGDALYGDDDLQLVAAAASLVLSWTFDPYSMS